MVRKSVTVFFCVLTVALTVLCVCMPGGSVVFLPAICVLGYYFSRQHHMSWILAVITVVYAAAGILFHGISVTYIGGAVLIAVLILPAALSERLLFWGEAALCTTLGVAAVCATTGIWALATHSTVTDLITREIVSFTSDPLTGFLAAREYARMSEEILGHAHLAVTDTGYTADTLEVLARVVAWELDGNLLWYLTGFGAFVGGVACAGGCALTSARKEPLLLQMRHIRLGRRYLYEICLPVIVFAFAAFYEPLEPIVRAVVNVTITLPTALCGLTLLYHTAMRFDGKPKIAASVVFWVITVAALVFYEWGMVILGFLGLADVILNARELLNKALE